MILSGVSISEVADNLNVSDEVLVGKLNCDMGIIDNFNVLFAIADIARRKESC